MKLADLDYSYPESLVAVHPEPVSRIMAVENKKYFEINKEDLFSKFSEGDVLVINDTKVIKRRVFAVTNDREEFEILFIEPTDKFHWQVLCRSGRVKKNEIIFLPEGLEVRIVETGIPQIVKVSKELDSEYFEKYGEMPVPPYIMKARNNVHNVKDEASLYQTKWAEVPGSQAAPTASFHFNLDDLESLRKRGVKVLNLTLHVGLGTFLSVKSEDLNQHKMHHEYVHIPAKTWDGIQIAKAKGNKVWAMGTTVTRALEACALNHLSKNQQGFEGKTDLLIQEGFQFKIVDRLLTNFHQPKSTLLALVCGFENRKTVFEAYHWAMEKKFRLFSYGDLTVWIK